MCRFFLVAIFLLSIIPSLTEAQHLVRGKVIDKDKNNPIAFASVRVVELPNVWAITDSSGRFTLKSVNLRNKHVDITLLGYAALRVPLKENGTYYLLPQIFSMEEVVVTATESKGVTSSSKIEKHAMRHLQPSSFADILELLPGGRSSAPVLNAPNTIHIREVPLSGDDYSTSSLGTSFVVDGAPVSTNANMQSMNGAWESQVTSRDFTNKGVDMRTISTDDIKSVEIVRGIPSVEYGDLTSGLVKIDRIKGGRDWAARFKADMKSKMYYISKGTEWKSQRLTWNVSADYLDSKADPRNTLNNYSRITVSSRLNKVWKTGDYKYSFSANADYGGSFDKEKTDPDLNYGAVDKYKSDYNRYASSLTFDLIPQESRFLKSLTVLASASLQHDIISRTRLVQLSRDTPAATTEETGESDAVILPYTYVASQSVNGMPFSAFAKVNTLLTIPALHCSNSLLLGGSWSVDKNYGGGQVFDVNRPLYPGISTRPRKYSSIPSTHLLSFYAEENMRIPVKHHSLDVVAGIRGEMMPNLPPDYEMKGRIYLNPRVNLRWTFPSFRIGTQNVSVALAGGVGQHTKMPTVSQFFPDPVYIDFTQLNYYHTNIDYRRINLMTYVLDPANAALKPAQNLKWELRSDISIGANRLSITYFEEDMTSGFRYTANYNSYSYKKYDASGIIGSTITAPPSLDKLPYVSTNELRGYTVTTNGSRTFKRGVEYTFSSQRVRALRTRLTVTGAWFKTEYRNSQPVVKRPSVVIDGEQLQYAGIYLEDDGYIREMANTNFTFDTDIPRLELGFSLSFQCLWFTASQTLTKSETPVRYMDKDGRVHNFTESDKNDMYLKWLVNSYSESLFARQTVPFGMNINFKATKMLMQKKFTVALFVNNMLDYYPDYKSNGLVIRRNVVPYFGVEMNIKL